MYWEFKNHYLFRIKSSVDVRIYYNKSPLFSEGIEAPPKTFTIKEKFEYFKPSVQVEMENFDKPDTVTEIYIRGTLLV